MGKKPWLKPPKDRRFKPPSPPPTPPVPLGLQCIYKPAEPSWMPKCTRAAEFLLDHEEFDPDDLPQYCSGHIAGALQELIEPGCGIDELTILRAPAVRITT